LHAEHGGKALLELIAKHGGLSEKKETALRGEMAWLNQHAAGGSNKRSAFGMANGVKGVFNDHGLTFDDMRELVEQESHFAHHTTSLSGFLDAIREAIDEKPEGLAADRLKESLGNGGGNGSVLSPRRSKTTSTRCAPTRKAIVRFDVNEFGEEQPRLPEAGSVREQEVATPEVGEVPFSLEAEPEQRRAVEPSLFGDEKPRFSENREPAPIFYSALTRAAENLPQAKGSPDQMAAMLQKGKYVTRAELDWSGVMPWLKEQTGSVTRGTRLWIS